MIALDSLPPLTKVIKDFGLLTQKTFSKSLGQNFLLDPGITDRIVQVAGDLKECDVIEIGPGPGGLTRSILKQNPHHLYALEKDPSCIAALQSLITASQGHLSLVERDALKVSLSDMTQYPIKVIANLPYNVGTLLLLKWLKNLERIQTLTLMFQKEVALRITAQPGTPDYGRLSILTQYLCHTERIFDLPPKAFIPAPKVFSSVVHLQPKPLSLKEKTLIPWLEKVTAAAFNQRRKMIRVSLKPLFGEENLQEILDKLHLHSTQRPETLTLKDYCALAAFYHNLELSKA